MSFKEQIMFKDKYPSIFSPQMEAILFIILQIFYATRTVLKIGGYSWISPSFSWVLFGHLTCLDQSHMSKKGLMDYSNIYCHISQPTPDPSDTSDQALSTAAIVMIVVGSYLALVIIFLLIRECLKVS